MKRAILVAAAGFVVACSWSGALAQDEDRILWRFEAKGSLIWHRPVTAPSGAIVFMDGGGTLYSVDPSGGQMWSVNTDGAGLGGPAAIGDDGTIYVSSNPLGSILNLRAYTPSGAPIWTFPDQSQELIAGPAVGPDGNIYAVNDVPGLGCFSLTPAGDLRWNNPGFSDFGTQGSEIVFGPPTPESGHTQLYFNANGLLTATRLDGNQRWQVNAGSQTKQVAVGTNGDVYCETWVTGAGIRLRAYDAKDGSVLWTFFQSPTNALSTPDVGPDGVIYIVRNLNQLHAINPNGTARWNAPANGNFGPPNAGQSPYHGPSVSPTNDVILLGGVTTFGGPGIVRAFNTDGDALWTVQLHDGDRPNNRARFSADGCTAYIAASNDSKASVYAFRICDDEPDASIPGDLDGNGSVGVADLLILLGAWGPCAECDSCPADFNDDCAVGVADLLALFENWG